MRLINLLVVLSPIIFFSCSQTRNTQQTNAAPINKELVLHLPPGPDNPRNSEGDFIKLKSGRLLFIYSRYTGNSSNDHASAYLASRYSDDGGATWSKEDVKVVEQEGKMNVMSVSLLRLKNGDIALYYLRKNSEADCIPVMRLSTDEAKTWGPPVDCVTDIKGYYVLNNDRVLQLNNGRIIMPLARHNTFDKPAFKESAKLFAYYSDDNGKSWKSSDEIPGYDSVVSQEPGIVPLTDGSLAMYIRTDNGYQFVSYSKDNGVSWSPIKPWTLHSPLSPASLEMIPGTKKLLAVWNNRFAYRERYKPNRFPLTIATSVNDGKSWDNFHDIETASTRFCYTAIHFEKDYLLLAYCSGGLDTTDIVRIPLKDIK